MYQINLNLMVFVIILFTIILCFSLIVSSLSCMCLGIKSIENFQHNLKATLDIRPKSIIKRIIFNFMLFCISKSLKIYKKDKNATIKANYFLKNNLHRLIVSIFAIIIYFIFILIFL